MFKIIKIFDNSKLISIILKKTKKKIKKRIQFFTHNTLPFQVGLFSHPEKHKIVPHFHNQKLKKIYTTSEFLFVLKGRVKVFFYNKKKKIINSKIIEKNDMILLLKGGHGFKILKKAVLIEIKQGPFFAEKDKIKF